MAKIALDCFARASVLPPTEWSLVLGSLLDPLKCAPAAVREAAAGLALKLHHVTPSLTNVVESLTARAMFESLSTTIQRRLAEDLVSLLSLSAITVRRYLRETLLALVKHHGASLTTKVSSFAVLESVFVGLVAALSTTGDLAIWKPQLEVRRMLCA